MSMVVVAGPLICCYYVNPNSLHKRNFLEGNVMLNHTCEMTCTCDQLGFVDMFYISYPLNNHLLKSL